MALVSKSREIPKGDCSVGVVVLVKKEKAEVRIDSAPCQGCKHSASCALWAVGDSTNTLWAHNKVGARVGDSVRVALSPGEKTKTACLLYLLPSICIVAGVLLGQPILGVALGVEPILGGAIGALIGFGFGLLPAIVVARRGGTLPVVVEVIKEG